jgi:hypothetical protein
MLAAARAVRFPKAGRRGRPHLNLITLDLSAWPNGLPEDTPSGTLVGPLRGLSPGTSPALADDALGQFQLQFDAPVWNVVVGSGLDFDSDPLPVIVVSESFPGRSEGGRLSSIAIPLQRVVKGPQLVSVSPAAGAVGASVSAPMVYVFDRDIFPGPFPLAELYTVAGGSTPVQQWWAASAGGPPTTVPGTGPGQYNIVGNTITFYPSANLPAGEGFYRFLYREAVQDAAGNTLRRNIEDDFSTGAAPVITGPSGPPGSLTSALSFPESNTYPRTLGQMKSSVAATWSKAGGVDASAWFIDATTGFFGINVATDFELGQRLFDVLFQATATAGGATSTQAVTGHVTNVDEGEPALAFTSFDDALHEFRGTLSEAATIKAAIHPRTSTPTTPQVIAGTGGGILAARSFTPADLVAEVWTITAPTVPNGPQALSMVAIDGSGNPSNMVTVNFTMAAPAAAPVLSAPDDQASGSTAGTGSVSTTGGDGTLYSLTLPLATAAPTGPAIKAAAGAVSQPVTAPGSQNTSVLGLTASTAYRTHWVHENAAGLLSNVVSGDGFTTAAGGSLTTLSLVEDWPDREVFPIRGSIGQTTARRTLTFQGSAGGTVQVQTRDDEFAGAGTRAYEDLGVIPPSGTLVIDWTEDRTPFWAKLGYRFKEATGVGGVSVNRFAVGDVIAVMGQSEVANIWTTTYSPIANAPAVDYPDDVAVFTGPLAPGNRVWVSNTTKGSAAHVDLANAYSGKFPRSKLKFIVIARQGTSPANALDDSNTSRNWSDDDAVFRLGTSNLKTMPSVLLIHWVVAPLGWNNNYGKIWSEILTQKRSNGTPFTLPNSTSYSGGFHLDHTYAEWFGSYPETRVSMVWMQEDSYPGATPSTPSTTATNMNLRKDFLAQRAAQSHFAAILDTLPIRDIPQQDRKRDLIHPQWAPALPGPRDGSSRMAISMLDLALETNGQVTRKHPVLDRVYMPANRAFIEFYSSAGAITTERLRRGEALPAGMRPVCGIARTPAGGAPLSETDYTIVNGRIRYTPPGGTVSATDTFGPDISANMGWRTCSAADRNGYFWKDMPVVVDAGALQGTTGNELGVAALEIWTAPSSVWVNAVGGSPYVPGADTTGPVLSLPTDAIASGTVTWGVTTDTGENKLWVAFHTGAAPTGAQIKAQSGGGIVGGSGTGGIAVASSGAKTGTLTAPASAGTYSTSFYQEDAAGNPSNVVTADGFTVAGADTTPPAITLTDPIDNATGVVTTKSIVITFNEAIALGTSGSITLRQNIGGTWSDAEVFDVATEVGTSDGQVSVSGSALTINPTGNLVNGREYAIRASSGAIKDSAGNAFAGIADDSTLSFTVAASGGTSLNVLGRTDAEAEQSSSDITWTGVAIDPAATSLVALITYRGPGLPASGNQFTIGGVAATLVGSLATQSGTGSQTRLYRLDLTAGSLGSSVNVFYDGLTGATGSGLLTLISCTGLASVAFAGSAPANGTGSGTATLDVLNGDRLYAHIFNSTGAFGTVTWSGVDEIVAANQVASDSYYAAIASKAITADATGYGVSASWVNTVNNILLGLMRLRGS